MPRALRFLYIMHANNSIIKAIRIEIVTPAMRATEDTSTHSASDDVVPAFTSLSPIVSHLKMFHSVISVYPVLE